MNGSNPTGSWVTGKKMMAGFAVAALAAGGIAGCGDDEDATAAIEVSGAWARTSPAMAQAGAAYMTITSEDGASIVAARVDPEVAGVAELHEVVPAEDAMAMDDMDDMDHGDMGEGEMDEGEMDHGAMDDMDGAMAMTMQEVPSIEVPAGGTVVFEPGGFHVMLLELPDPLETGEEFDITLTLDDDTEIIVPVTVSETAP